jgi:hypothetical protein
LWACFVVRFVGGPSAEAAESTEVIDYSAFKDPPAQYRGIHWVGFDLSRINDESVIARVRAGAQRGAWGSFMIEAGGGPTTGLSEAYLRAYRREPSTEGVPFLSQEFFRLYRLAIEEGLKNNFPLNTLYDEWNYPIRVAGP